MNKSKHLEGSGRQSEGRSELDGSVVSGGHVVWIKKATAALPQLLLRFVSPEKPDVQIFKGNPTFGTKNYWPQPTWEKRTR